MSIANALVGKYLYLTPSGRFDEPVLLEDMCLIKIKEIASCDAIAAYMCTFDVIAGKPDKCFTDVVWTEKGCIGRLGLAATARLTDQAKISNKYIRYLEAGEKLVNAGFSLKHD